MDDAEAKKGPRRERAIGATVAALWIDAAVAHVVALCVLAQWPSPWTEGGVVWAFAPVLGVAGVAAIVALALERKRSSGARRRRG
jgi:hypothetical protein